MKKETIKEVKIYDFLCDICERVIIQDGKDIELINDFPRGNDKYSFTFHSSCLNRFLARYFHANKVI